MTASTAAKSGTAKGAKATEVADKVTADLIIMGSRGMSEWKSLLLGGVAAKVVAQASCPVLLVR